MPETAPSPRVADEEQPVPVPVPSAAETTPARKDFDYDSKFFHQIIQDAGRWAFGVIFAEVWVLNEDRTHLFRPECGWWIDQVATDFGANSKFDRLTDPTHPDYLEPAPLAPGIGLAGCLWSETSHGNAAADGRRGRQSMFSGDGNTTRERLSIFPGAGSGGRDVDRFESNRDSQRRSGLLARNVAWRQVKSLCDDPDQPYNPRLEYLGEIGLGWAAGVPFSVGPTEGIVVYMARDTADERKLRAPANQDYLIHASLVIGSAYALRVPRLVVEKERKAERKNAIDRLRAKVRAVIRMSKNLKDIVLEGEATNTGPSGTGGKLAVSPANAQAENHCSDFIVQRIRLTVKKFLGAANMAPRAFTWDQTAWTFAGSLLTLSVLTTLNTALKRNFGPSHSIVLGPFGALMTLQYGLTAAPASQPRNAIIGQFIGIFIAHGVGQAVNLEPWLKQTLATSLAISCMVKLGVTHPPAGAAALLFSDGKKTWQQIGMMFLGNVIAIVCAAIINNLSERRQYPTFWGFQPIIDMIKSDDDERDKEKKKA